MYYPPWEFSTIRHEAAFGGVPWLESRVTLLCPAACGDRLRAGTGPLATRVLVLMALIAILTGFGASEGLSAAIQKCHPRAGQRP